MYNIEQRKYGIRLTFGGFIQKDEMDHWVADFIPVVDKQGGKYTVFVDMRTLKPLPPEAQESMEKGQKYALQKGMIRSVVILDNAVTTSQFKRIAKKTGIYEWERYIDATAEPNWEQIGLDWIVKSVDPDK